MNAHGMLSGWASSNAPSRIAAELASGLFNPSTLGTVLSQTAPHLGDVQFLILRASDLSLAEVEQAQESFMAGGGTARLCLAGQRATLEHLAESDGERVGFMLDDMDLQTPCSELIWDGFEAVRFSDHFVAQALRDVRAGCAFDSMLGLARELGLRTLGPIVAAQFVPFDRFAFDYVPADIPWLMPKSRTALKSCTTRSSIISQ